MRRITAGGNDAYFCGECYFSAADAAAGPAPEPQHDCESRRFIRRLLDPEDLGHANRDEIIRVAAGVAKA